MRKDQTAALRKQNIQLDQNTKLLSSENAVLTDKFFQTKNLMMAYEHERIMVGLNREVSSNEIN